MQAYRSLFGFDASARNSNAGFEEGLGKLKLRFGKNYKSDNTVLVKKTKSFVNKLRKSKQIEFKTNVKKTSHCSNVKKTS